MLLAVDGYRHGGRDYDRTEPLRAILAELPTVRHTVLLPYLSPEASAAGLPGGMSWSELLELGRGASDENREGEGAGARIQFEQVPFDAIPCGCCIPRAPPDCPRRSCTGTGGSCWSS